MEDKGNLDETNYLGFLKAFLSAPPKIPLSKINSHVIQGKVLVWIKNCSGRCVHRKQDWHKVSEVTWTQRCFKAKMMEGVEKEGRKLLLSLSGGDADEGDPKIEITCFWDLCRKRKKIMRDWLVWGEENRFHRPYESLWQRRWGMVEDGEQRFVKSRSGGTIRQADSDVQLKEAGRFQVDVASILKHKIISELRNWKLVGGLGWRKLLRVFGRQIPHFV